MMMAASGNDGYITVRTSHPYCIRKKLTYIHVVVRGALNFLDTTQNEYRDLTTMCNFGTIVVENKYNDFFAQRENKPP